MPESSPITVASARVYVGPQVPNMLLPDADAQAAELAEFEASDWTEIGHVTDLGSMGAEGADVSYTVISDRATHRSPGIIDNGQMEVIAARDPSDPGQAILRNAVQNDSQPRRFRVELNDAPEPNGTGSSFYFRGVTASAKDALGDGTEVIKTTFAIGISGLILETEPADAETITMTPSAGALTGGTEDIAYAGVTITAPGGVGIPTFSVVSGALPAGLTLNPTTGAISGTPTVAGAYSFTVRADYTINGRGQAAYTLTVAS